MGNIFGIWKKKDEDNFTESFFTKSDLLLQTTDLENPEKILFRRRYMNKLYSLRYYKHVYTIWFYFYRFLATTLGVAIPALLSVQYYYSTSVENPIYWTAWGLSILSGFATGYNNVFKVDQRYFLLKNIYQRLKNEGWCYILLCKQYDVRNNNTKVKHKELFIIFMQSVEDIINDYHKNDIETVMQEDKKNETEIQQIQERTVKQLNLIQESSESTTKFWTPEQFKAASDNIKIMQQNVDALIQQKINTLERTASIPV